MDDFSIDPFWIDISPSGITGVVGEDLSYRAGGVGSFCFPFCDAMAANSFRNGVTSAATVSEENRNILNNGINPELGREVKAFAPSVSDQPGIGDQHSPETICFTTDSTVVSLQANAPVRVASSSTTALWKDISNAATDSNQFNGQTNNIMTGEINTTIVNDIQYPPIGTTILPMSYPLIMPSTVFRSASINDNTITRQNHANPSNQFVLGPTVAPTSTYLSPFCNGLSGTLVVPPQLPIQAETQIYSTNNTFSVPFFSAVNNSTFKAGGCQKIQEYKRQFRDRNEREQMRAKRIAELITTLHNSIQSSGWILVEKKSKCHTLSQAKAYIEHLLQTVKEKREHIKFLQNILAEKQNQTKPVTLRSPLDYKILFKTSNIPQVIASVSRILMWNNFFLELTGLAPEDLKQLTLFSLIQVGHLSRLFEFAATALQQSPSDDISATTIDTDTITAADYESITFPCIDFAILKKKSLESRYSHATSKELFITITVIRNDEHFTFNKEKFFHCCLVNCPGKNGALGNITPDLLSSLVHSNAKAVL